MAMEFIVFESQGIQFTPGAAIDAKETIKLEAGQTLTLISPNGHIIKLSGPYDQLVNNSKSSAQKGISDTLKVLLNAEKTNTKDMGVTRNTSDIIRSSNKYGWVPEPWLVNIKRSGDYCVLQGKPVQLWRSDTQPEKLKLSMNNEYEAYKWIKKDEMLMSTPPGMPIVDGATYQFIVDKKTIHTTWHVIPDSVTSVATTAAWMEASGCRAQAIAMLRNYKD